MMVFEVTTIPWQTQPKHWKYLLYITTVSIKLFIIFDAEGLVIHWKCDNSNAADGIGRKWHNTI